MSKQSGGAEIREEIIELKTLDYAAERDRLYRMRDAAPEMYKLLRLCIEALDDYLPFECAASKVSKLLLARIDGEEEQYE